jgi:hypothetical protein
MAPSEAVLHNKLTKVFSARWSLFGMKGFFNVQAVIPDDRSGFWTYGSNLLD